jgi:hypothetical protein
VIEVWIENEMLVEILPPEYAREYLPSRAPREVGGDKQFRVVSS